MSEQRQVDPPEQVVFTDRDGTERRALLHRWRRDDDGWHAHLSWSTGVGLNHIGWFHADVVRRVADEPDDVGT